MNQRQRRIFLIKSLLKERGAEFDIPADDQEQKRLLRALFNVRPPADAADEFLFVQNQYLREEIAKKGITDYKTLEKTAGGFYLWRGDITTLACGAIVNAANSGMLGCFAPNHGCIDNAIHTYAGVQLRRCCAEIMDRQGEEEKPGGAKITPSFNLPCDFVLHTVGSVVADSPTAEDEETLASCYVSCMKTAAENDIKSVAFCCISTGEFNFPNERAAQIAVETVKNFLQKNKCGTEVIFNVFKQIDLDIYARLLR